MSYDHLMGWAGVDRALLEKALVGAPGDIRIIGDGPSSRRMMLFELTRKVLGKDTPNYAQEIGDCTSFGTKNAVEYLEACQIVMGNLADFRPVFPCYIYGCGRIYYGGGGGWGDGGVGVWMADAVKNYGILASDEEGVPKYQGSVAKSWGRSDSGFKQFEPTAKQHLVKQYAKVSTRDQLVQSITNLYPVTVCSNQGFTMAPQSDGFHHPKGSWPHCMCIIGVDDDGGSVPSHVCILNSWGDVMGGPMKDFRDPSLIWPVGTLRVEMSVVEDMLRQDDSWAFSAFEDFPAQILKESDFSMI